MLFERKIYKKFLSWKNESQGQKALLVEGARRIGKSTVVEEFGKNEYKSYILIDFSRTTDDVRGYFYQHLNDLDTFFMLLSVNYGVQLYPRESLIIFDEVQMFPKAREAIKHLVADGRYDYIETGSLISIKENVKDIVIPSEERQMKMYPLDFEEFCWALGEKPLIPYIRSCFEGFSGVEEVTGMGLMIGIKTAKPAAEIVKKCIGKGVLCLTAKDKVRLLPALNIPMELIEEAVSVIKDVIAENC